MLVVVAVATVTGGLLSSVVAVATVTLLSAFDAVATVTVFFSAFVSSVFPSASGAEVEAALDVVTDIADTVVGGPVAEGSVVFFVCTVWMTTGEGTRRGGEGGVTAARRSAEAATAAAAPAAAAPAAAAFAALAMPPPPPFFDEENDLVSSTPDSVDVGATWMPAAALVEAAIAAEVVGRRKARGAAAVAVAVASAGAEGKRGERKLVRSEGQSGWKIQHHRESDGTMSIIASITHCHRDDEVRPSTSNY